MPGSTKVRAKKAAHAPAPRPESEEAPALFLKLRCLGRCDVGNTRTDRRRNDLPARLGVASPLPVDVGDEQVISSRGEARFVAGGTVLHDAEDLTSFELIGSNAVEDGGRELHGLSVERADTGVRRTEPRRACLELDLRAGRRAATLRGGGAGDGRNDENRKRCDENKVGPHGGTPECVAGLCLEP